jgi:hypothetical protein
MNGSSVIIFMISFAISFAIDPTPTLPEDTTDFHFSMSASDNSNNKKMAKMVRGKFMTQSTFVLIQTITCTCGFEWQETWILSNWLWLKSSSSDDHWSSNR